MKDKAAITAEINRIIESPSKKPTKQEAMKTLRSCGILDKNNKLKPVFKGILIKKDDEK